MGLYTQHAFIDKYNQVTIIRKRLMTPNRCKIPSLNATEIIPTRLLMLISN